MGHEISSDANKHGSTDTGGVGTQNNAMVVRNSPSSIRVHPCQKVLAVAQSSVLNLYEGDLMNSVIRHLPSFLTTVVCPRLDL